MISDDVYVTSKFLDCSTFCHMDIISHPTLKGGFDVIYGADIIYGALHTTWIKSCVEQSLCKPLIRHPAPPFHLIILLQTTHAVESSMIKMVFWDYREFYKL